MSGDATDGFTDEDLAYLHRVFEAARTGDLDLLAVIDRGVPVNLTNDKGDTLLILAAYHLHRELVDGLLQRGADPDRVNDRGQTALGCAAFRQSETLVRRLLDAGADPVLGRQSARETARFFGLESILRIIDERLGAGHPAERRAPDAPHLAGSRTPDAPTLTEPDTPDARDKACRWTPTDTRS